MSEAGVEPEGQASPGRRGVWSRVILLAACLTLLNAFKPLHIDDTAYYFYARHIAQNPLDPYGFALCWYNVPEPANSILAPPVFLYWLALGMALLGDNPILWKLWLFPICLLFVWAVHRLSRRFTHHLDWPVTLLIVLSPAFLPGLNLMLDIPAFALGLTALELFIAGTEKQSWGRVLAAGLVAGLAMQTKYTAVVVPAAMGLWALVRLRPWPEWVMVVVAGVLAAGVFCSWEVFTHHRYGQSHFWLNYKANQSAESWWVQKQKITPQLPCLLGSVSPAVVLLGLAALRVHRWAVALLGGVMLGGFAVIACFQIRFNAALQHSQIVFGPDDVVWVWPFTLTEIIFGAYGLVLVSVVAGVLWFLGRGQARLDRWLYPPGPGTPPSRTRWLRHEVELFLISWLLLEIGGYFMLTPFTAVRRVMGLVLVLSLLTGRLASLSCRDREGRWLVWSVVGYGVALGLFYQAADIAQANLQAEGPRLAREWIDARRGDPLPKTNEVKEDGRIWFSGHWGFQFYAERQGMHEVILPYHKPNVPFPMAERSRLRKGDWLVVPDWRVYQAGVDRKDEPLVEVCHLTLNDGWPLKTLHCYYGGSTGLDHSEGRARFEIKIFRVTRDFDAWPGQGGFLTE